MLLHTHYRLDVKGNCLGEIMFQIALLCRYCQTKCLFICEV
ncbi:hypothetical protein HMPREF3212_01840 [Citrobacter freundii]|nr:hypothetical protein AB07_2929 [Citrobacter freundii]KWZ91219.1 hypothetical protein HMPREF3212_01840 [Citrobacter freundii]